MIIPFIISLFLLTIVYFAPQTSVTNNQTNNSPSPVLPSAEISPTVAPTTSSTSPSSSPISVKTPLASATNNSPIKRQTLLIEVADNHVNSKSRAFNNINELSLELKNSGDKATYSFVIERNNQTIITKRLGPSTDYVQAIDVSAGTIIKVKTSKENAKLANTTTITIN